MEKKRESLSTKSLSLKILIGLGLGVLAGLFLGEYAGHLALVGDAFIGLLQMTVLPYIILTLIVNIGRLSLDEGKKMVTNAIVILIILLSFGFLTVLVFSLALPEWSSGNFFNSSLIEEASPLDIIKIYIPSNPFQSMADNMVPAVVLFSILVGIAFIRVKDKESILHNMDILAKALNQVNKMVIKITPLGVFAIAASTTGTISLDEISKLQAYILIYTAIVLILTFWVLPSFIMATTPVKYREIFRATRGTLLTIFATGKIIVVLPQLIDDIKSIIEKHGDLDDDTKSATNVLMPLAYPFPNLGSLTIFIFVIFSGWYIGKELTIDQYPLFVGSGLLSSFINPITGIPFMLNLLDLPDDMLMLFQVSTVYTDRIRVVLGAMHLIALTLISVYASTKTLKINYKKFIRYNIFTVFLFIGSIWGIRTILSASLEGSYKMDKVVMEMTGIFPDVPMEIITEKPNPVKLIRSQTKLSRIKKRGKIRIASYNSNMPFSYKNSFGQRVGYDIEMAHHLAKALNVELELFLMDDLYKHIGKDYFDIFMGVPLSTKIAEQFSVSEPFMDLTMALLTKDSRDDFRKFKSHLNLDTFTVAYLERKEFADKFQNYFPKAGVVQLDSIMQFFNNSDTINIRDSLTIDALIVSAEGGATYTMLYPNYQLVNPFPYNISVPRVFLFDKPDPEFREFVNNFIKIQQKDGTLENLYDYWILGKDININKKNWSIIRDVFHWVD
ncbi:MAG: hypothetical protein DRJ07_01935 [Bacteroidetes bacterium]|nr:MAG: hypothetical protein DRJ07_01935 [Bacteroidota bacterium]